MSEQGELVPWEDLMLLFSCLLPAKKFTKSSSSFSLILKDFYHDMPFKLNLKHDYAKCFLFKLWIVRIIQVTAAKAAIDVVDMTKKLSFKFPIGTFPDKFSESS